jgi:PAS domain S-box-containing protein
MKPAWPLRRVAAVLFGSAYIALLITPLVMLVQGRTVREAVTNYVSAEDRWSVFRTQLEFFRVISAVDRAALGDPEAGLSEVKERVDLLYSRLDALKNYRDKEGFLRLPAYQPTLAMIDHVIEVADATLPTESGPGVSAETVALLEEALAPVGDQIAELQRQVLAATAEDNDALRSKIATQSELEIAALLALIVASLGAVGGLVWNNRRLARLTAAAQLSEARLRGFMDNAPATMALMDPDGRYLLLNPRVEQLHGRAATAMLGRTETEIAGEDEAAATGAIEREAVSTGQSASGEVRHRRDGRDLWSAEIRFPIVDAAGRLNAIGAIGLDISSQKRTEAALKAATQRAEAANRAKSDFLANMSHELRTPLNAIIGFADIIASETFGPHATARYREYATDIVSSGHHLLDLVADILDLSKVEAGQYPLSEARCQPKNIAESALFFIRERAAARRLALTIDIEPDLPDLYADRRALLQVLVNLLANAVKFTPEGGRIRLAVERHPSGGLAFVVSDTGIGIAAEDLPRVLEPFGQVDDPYVQRRDGTGLGLPIAKALAEKHNGTLTIESTLGVGTVVTILLPASRILAAV